MKTKLLVGIAFIGLLGMSTAFGSQEAKAGAATDAEIQKGFQDLLKLIDQNRENEKFATTGEIDANLYKIYGPLKEKLSAAGKQALMVFLVEWQRADSQNKMVIAAVINENIPLFYNRAFKDEHEKKIVLAKFTKTATQFKTKQGDAPDRIFDGVSDGLYENLKNLLKEREVKK